MAKNGDDIYSWLDEHSTDPRQAAPAAPASPAPSSPVHPDAPPPPPPPASATAPPPPPPPAPAAAPPPPPAAPATAPPATSPPANPAAPPPPVQASAPPPPPFLGDPSPLPSNSPDGSITYTSTGPSTVSQSYGGFGTTASNDPGVTAPYQPPPPSKRSTGIGSAGKPQRRGGFLGWIGRVLKVRFILGLIGLAIAGVLALFGVGSGTKSVSSLDPGDCFEQVTEVRVRSVTVQDCALAHDSQVYAVVRTFEDEIVGEMCLEEFVNLEIDFEALPPDFELGHFEGTLRHRCIIESPSGQLVGSLVD